MLFTSILSLLLLFVSTALTSAFDDPNAGPPAGLFAAGPAFSLAALQSEVAKASKVALEATYPINSGSNAPQVTIHSDWADFSEGAAFVWVADMDVDCDGLNFQCEGNQDGQAVTDFGALSAYAVPFIVIPNRFGVQYKGALPGNNVAAVICNGKMFYGIYGDTNGASPQAIGEASWLMAQTCFPNDNLNGNRGHAETDVTYIVFTGNDAVLPGSALNEHYITDFTTLRSMGDKLVHSLAKSLQLVAGSGKSDFTATTFSTAVATTTATGSPCSWEGHCADAPCSIDDDCVDGLACEAGKCTSS
ncbi:hypothetical protein N7452_001148 [Penicillium brevicompactum]|uniref:Endo-chitosanase n=1 Tax=Penicillium brevicompactum TaxID=5074 RepID=A0A9W9R4Q5_PENBR|nr:hypothetical protein N7452_001148 [Penicillium brevicompactum]